MEDSEEDDMDVNKAESAAHIARAGEEDEGPADREEDEMNAQEEEMIMMCDQQEKGEGEDERCEGEHREGDGEGDGEDKKNPDSGPKGTSWCREELIGQGTACSESGETAGDPLAVVHRLLELASQPENRPAMAREPGCAAGLALLARHGQPRVSNTALRALCFLAESPGSLELLREEQALLPALLSIRDGGDAPTEASSVAADIIDFLDGWGLGRAASSGILEECPLSTLEGLAVSVDRAEGRVARHRARCFLGRANRRAKTITLQIDGLDDLERRTMCEEALLGVRGVISFTFQMVTQRCVLRTRADLPTEKLGLAIAATCVMSAQKVIRNEQGEEVLLPLTPEGTAAAAVSLPSYLPEDDEEEGVPAAPYKAMSALGGGLGDRRQGWMTAAASFLTQNFYW